jgi:hypothetical protein
MLQRFFGNSRERLVLSLLGDADATPEELERMKRAIAEAAPGEGDLPIDAPEEA